MIIRGSWLLRLFCQKNKVKIRLRFILQLKSIDRQIIGGSVPYLIALAIIMFSFSIGYFLMRPLTNRVITNPM